MSAETSGRFTDEILGKDRRIRVLYVDDDADFCRVASASLEDESDRIVVSTVTDAREALERDLGGFDCVVSDYEMPSMDGLEFFEAVNDEHPELPFVLFTGRSTDGLASEAVSAGVTDYFRKRGGTEQFIVIANRVENIVERTRARRAAKGALEAIERAREGISILNDDGEFVYVNKKYAEAFGYDRDELVGEGWEVLYTEEGKRQMEEAISGVPEEGEWDGELACIRKDGTKFVASHSVFHTDSGTVCFVGETFDS